MVQWAARLLQCGQLAVAISASSHEISMVLRLSMKVQHPVICGYPCFLLPSGSFHRMAVFASHDYGNQRTWLANRKWHSVDRYEFNDLSYWWCGPGIIFAVSAGDIVTEIHSASMQSLLMTSMFPPCILSMVWQCYWRHALWSWWRSLCLPRWIWVFVILFPLLKRILIDFHAGHPGISCMKALMRN